MKKRIAAILLVLMLCSSLLTTAYAQTISFSDVPTGYWGYSTIMRMTKDGLFKGTSEPVNGVGTFMPEKTMTRAEFVTAVLRAVYPEQAAGVQNVAGKWWLGYYHMALKYGILFTGELNNGAMDQPMTRQEMAMVLVRALEVNRERPEQLVYESQIADYNSISDTYKTFVRQCFSMGLIAGVDKQGTFAPTKSLTRAEAATVLCRLLYEDERVEVDLPDEKEEEKDDNKKPSSSGSVGSSSSGGNLSGGSNNNSGNSSSNSGNSGSGSGNNSGNTGGSIVLPEEEDDSFRETTWEEYVAMSEEDRISFRVKFDSEEDFKAWLDSVQEDPEIEEEEAPWEKGGKTPDRYTLEQYANLSPELQQAFEAWFGSQEDFYAWMDAQVGEEEPDVDEEDQFGGRTLEDFTFEDYFEMDIVDQAAFKEQFFGGDDDALLDWIDSQIGEPEL